MRADVLASVSNIGKVFEGVGPTGQFEALRDVSLDIQKGEFISVVGASGCGKSTLLNLLACLTEPTSGHVKFKGEMLTKPRREIGLMFQTPVMLPWRTVEKNALLPAEIFGLKGSEIQDRVRTILDRVGLSGFREAYPSQLSGGMKQRAALGRVLAYEPELLLMDEPFGSLDEFTREDMNVLVTGLVHQWQITAMLVTHNITEAILLADRVVVMGTNPGRIIGVVDVPFPQPRDIDIMRKQEFTDLTFEVRALLGGAR